MITLNTRRIELLERALKKLSDRAIPFATRNFVNDVAFKIREEAQVSIREKMVTRNKWTERSVMVDRARGPFQNARVGSTQEYMLDQEFGATKRRRGKEGVNIPTSYSAGQQGAQPRTKLPRKQNSLREIKLKNKRVTAKNRRMKNFLLVKQAVETKQRYVFMDLGRRKGIFRVAGGRISKGHQDGHRVKGARVRLVHDLTKAAVRIPPTPWLEPASDKVAKAMPRMYARRLIEQIRRERLFQER